MIFEKLFDEFIDFEYDLFQRSDEGEIKLFSTKLFNKSLMKFTIKIISQNKIQIKYMLLNIDDNEVEKFKRLTNDDIKNIVYNELLGNSIKPIYNK